MRSLLQTLSLLAAVSSLTACNLKDWVTQPGPPLACQKQKGNWYTPQGDNWKINADCSGSEVACGYVYDAFYIHGDGTAVLNLQKSNNTSGCLGAPQTYDCAIQQPAVGMMVLTCAGLTYTMSTRAYATQMWQRQPQRRFR